MSKLLAIRDTVNYYLYRKPVKMSRSFDGLAALIRTEMDKDIINGDVFIFLNRSRTISRFLYMSRNALVYSIEDWMKAPFNCLQL